VELIGGRQASLILVETSHEIATTRYRMTAAPPRPVALPPRLSDAELVAHAAFIASLGTQAIWLDYRPG
jgi:DNA polymerase-3 subunit epsilon